MKKTLAILTVLATFAAGCGGSDEPAATTTTSPATTTTTTNAAATTTTTTAPPSTSTTAPPSGATVSCTSQDGFSVTYPESWVTADEGELGHCARFHTAPFTVPEGTDVRITAISLYTGLVDFATAAQPMGDEVSRAVTAIDGRQAVRIERIADGDAFYPDGTRITSYFVDLGAGTNEDDSTLIADLVDLTSADYAEAQTVLDHIARSLEITAGDPAEDDIVARYEGGATPFTVAATTEGGDVCLNLDPGAAAGCAAVPPPA